MNVLPFECDTRFVYEDFCEGCPELKVDTAVEISTGVMGEHIVNIYHTCPDLDKCRRLKHILINKK